MRRTYTLAGAWIGGPLLCLSLLALSQNLAVEAADQEEKRQPKVLERYRQAWEAHKGELDLERIARLVADLGSKDTSARRVAFAGLKQESGLERVNWHYVFDPDGDPGEQKRIRQDWEDYARWLKVAVKKVVPLLMEKPGRNNESERAPRAFRLGLGAPHRAFLPLLREIIANPKETKHMRYRALRGIALIPHDGLIEYLLEQMDDQDLYWAAWNLIDRLTRRRLPRVQPRKNDPAEWRRAKTAFLKWWAVNKKDFKYNRFWVITM